jgi:hypothetical protein
VSDPAVSQDLVGCVQYPSPCRNTSIPIAAGAPSRWRGRVLPCGEAGRSSAAKLGIAEAETLRQWLRQAEAQPGQGAGVTSEESAPGHRSCHLGTASHPDQATSWPPGRPSGSSVRWAPASGRGCESWSSSPRGLPRSYIHALPRAAIAATHRQATSLTRLAGHAHPRQVVCFGIPGNRWRFGGGW